MYILLYIGALPLRHTCGYYMWRESVRAANISISRARPSTCFYGYAGRPKF